MQPFDPTELLATGMRRIRSTAIAPGLWMIAIVGGLCLPAAYAFQLVGAPLLALAAFGVFGCVVLTVLAITLLFAFKDPDRLQSEDYRIRQQTLTLVGNKATGFRIAPVDLPSIMHSEDVSKKHLEEGKQAKMLPRRRRRRSEADDG